MHLARATTVLRLHRKRKTDMKNRELECDASEFNTYDIIVINVTT